MLDAISRVALVAERNAPIRMTFTGQEVALSAGSVDEAQANETLDIDMDGDDITVAFNPSYLKEGLSAVTEPFVRITMASRKLIPTSPWTTDTCSCRCALTTEIPEFPTIR